MRESAKAGFTLAEVVVAVMLFALCTAGVFALSRAVLRMNAFSEQTTRATTLAESRIEEFLNAGPGAGPGTNVVAPYTVVWTVTNNAALRLRTARVTVRWQDADGNTKQVALRGMRND